MSLITSYIITSYMCRLVQKNIHFETERERERDRERELGGDRERL